MFGFVTESSYSISFLGGPEGGSTMTVERPGSDGESGGKCTHRAGVVTLDGGDAYTTKFNEIRAHIDDVVRPWHSLKEPTGIDTLKESLDDVFTYIAPNGAQSGGGTGVQAEITEIQRHLGDMSGGTIAAYKSNFLGVLDDVANNLYLLAANTAASLGASKGAVEGAQKAFLEALDQSTVAFNSVTGSAGEFKPIIQIISAANSGIGGFLPPQAKAVSGAAGAVLGLIEKLTPADPAAKQGVPADYNAAMTDFEDMVKLVNETLKAAEDDIEKQARDCYLSTINQHKHFDLSVPKLSNDEGSVDFTKIDEDAMNDIISTYMPAITSDLQSAGNAALAAKMTNEVERDASLGNGAKGPASQVGGVADLLKDLSWETEFSEEQLRLALADFQNQDASSADALRKYEEKINSNPYDPDDAYI